MGLICPGILGPPTYLLARYPDTFPALLDDALSSVSPKASGAADS
jgi:hypothetical protein